MTLGPPLEGYQMGIILRGAFGMQNNSAKNKLNHLSRKFMNNSFAMAAVGVLALSLPVAYTNCSAKMNFEASEESRLASLNSSGSIVINDGDEFTRSEAVTLSISHIAAEQMYVTNDPTCETGGQWQAVAGKIPWQLASKNSSAGVYVKFSNDGDGGLASGCLSDSIVHDDIPPVLNVVTAPAAYTNASSVSATLESSDSGSGVASASCDVGSGSSPSNCSPTSLSVQSPTEGVNTYTIEVRDRAGNSSDPQVVSFVADRSVPTIMLNLTPSRISNQARSEFRFSGTDAVSGIEKYECRIGDAASFASQTFAECPGGIKEETFSAGPKKFEVRSIDRAGNQSSVASYDWTIDLAAPTVMITRMPAPYSNVVNPTFEFVGTDDGGPLARYECSVDGGTAVACTSPHALANLSNGPRRFSVVGIDTAGNRSAPAEYNWIVDTVAPTISLTSTPSAISNDKNPRFVIAANDANGIEQLECQLDSGAYEPCTADKMYTNLPDGDRLFRARARDRAGNLSDPVSYAWKIDSSKPTIMITSGPERWIRVRNAAIAFTANDVNVASGLPALRIECKLNDGSYATCTSPQSYTGLNEGSYLFVVRAVDAAGNVSDEANLTWGVDMTPPSINFGRQPLSLIYIGERAEIFFAATDPGTNASGLASVMCGLQGSLAACTPETLRQYASPSPGSFRFQVVATDNAGNTANGEVVWQVSSNTIDVTQTVNVRRMNKIDVLVVIDNSGSMETEHKNMATRFGTFLDQLSGQDWQVGIVTTDARTRHDNSRINNRLDGKLLEFKRADDTYSGQYMITSAMDSATAKAWFAKTIQMETDGSGNEQGVAMTYRAVERALNGSGDVNARNRALIRNDAALAVLVVTDADETTGTTQDRNRPEFVYNYIRTSYPDKPFSYNSIIVPLADAACLGVNGNEQYGYAYDAFSRMTGGIVGTVCATDYGSQLKDIGKATQDLVRSVTLNCTPIDYNMDGQPDLQVTTSDGSAAPPFTIMGMRVNFASPLPVGMTTLRYRCIAPMTM